VFLKICVLEEYTNKFGYFKRKTIDKNKTRELFMKEGG